MPSIVKTAAASSEFVVRMRSGCRNAQAAQRPEVWHMCGNSHHRLGHGAVGLYGSLGFLSALCVLPTHTRHGREREGKEGGVEEKRESFFWSPIILSLPFPFFPPPSESFLNPPSSPFFFFFSSFPFPFRLLRRKEKKKRRTYLLVPPPPLPHAGRKEMVPCPPILIPPTRPLHSCSQG